MKAINVFIFFFIFSFSLFAQTYIQVGADPQDLQRKVRSDEMLIKYLKDFYVRTESGSGKVVTGILRKGEPLIVKKDDFQRGEIKDFVILQCGNETSVYSRVGVSSLQYLDMNNVEVIWTNTPQIVKEKVYVPQEEPSPQNYYPPSYPHQPPVVEKSDHTLLWVIGGVVVASIIATAILLNHHDSGVVVNNYTSGGTGSGTGGGPVNPPNGPVNPGNGVAIPRGVVIGGSFGLF